MTGRRPALGLLCALLVTACGGPGGPPDGPTPGSPVATPAAPPPTSGPPAEPATPPAAAGAAPVPPAPPPDARAATPALVTSSLSRQPPSPGLGDLIQRALEDWLGHQEGTAAVAVAVASTSPEPTVWSAAAHRPGSVPVGVDDAYGALSMTKTFTEALVLRAVSAGLIQLDEPVPALPGVDVPGPAARITPRMLLQHTSGLVNYASAAGYDPTAPITPVQIVNLGVHSPLLSAPGERASYSNTNFHWLGLVLEQVTGQSFGQLVAALAAEAGLGSTSYDPTGRPGWTGFASGGVRSTVGDLARWGAQLFSPGEVLHREQLDELITIGGLGVGLGLWPICPCAAASGDPAGVGQIVAHGGLVYYPDDDLVVVVHLDPPVSTSGERTAAIGEAVRTAIGR